MYAVFTRRYYTEFNYKRSLVQRLNADAVIMLRSEPKRPALFPAYRSVRPDKYCRRRGSGIAQLAVRSFPALGATSPGEFCRRSYCREQ